MEGVTNVKRTLLMALGVLALTGAIVLLWPAPQPLQGVETVAVEGEGNLPGDLVEGLEIALDDRQIRVVSESENPDAVITLVEPTSANVDFQIGDGGFQGEAHLALRVERDDGRQHMMDLNVRFDGTDLTAELTSRPFWQVWK